MSVKQLMTTAAFCVAGTGAAMADDVKVYALVGMAEIIDVGNTPNEHSKQQYIMVSDKSYETVEKCQASMLFNQLNMPEPYPVMRRKLQLEAKTTEGERIRPPWMDQAVTENIIGNLQRSKPYMVFNAEPGGQNRHN